jgi:hypothetical protein
MGGAMEGFHAKLASLAAVVGVIIAFLAWRYPHPPGNSNPPPSSVIPISQVPPATPRGGKNGSPHRPPVPAENRSKTLPRSITANQPKLGITQFTLIDGEQKVFLSGQVAVGIQFSQFGEERFSTILLTIDNKTNSYAMLTPTARIYFTLGETRYYLSILNQNSADRNAQLRIDLAQGDMN